MCTILLQSETLPAEKRSRKKSQAEVDKLMEYDRKLSEPFTKDELQKIFSKDRMETSSITKCLSPLLSAELYADYLLLTDVEKEIVADLGLTPPKTDKLPINFQEHLSNEDRRRQLKADLLISDYTLGYRNSSGHIYVWLDAGCYCKPKKKGFYYVRYYNSISQCYGNTYSTAYAHPALVVQKNKLRPDQIEFMERLRQETIADAKRED